MVDVDAFDLESGFPKFLESFLQKVETILQDVEEQNLDAGVLAEVVDQTISLIQTLQEPGEIQSLDIIALNSLAGTFTNVLALLWNHISLLKGSQRQTCMDNVVFLVASHYQMPSSYIFALTSMSFRDLPLL